jgi:hypothetical protein
MDSFEFALNESARRSYADADQEKVEISGSSKLTLEAYVSLIETLHGFTAQPSSTHLRRILYLLRWPTPRV